MASCTEFESGKGICRKVQKTKRGETMTFERFRWFAGLFLFISLFAGYAAEHPNVVIIYADDMGYGDLGVNNPASKIPTPHLDQLASEGLRFTDGHSSSGICTPSRFALLTGQHHWRRFHNIVSAFRPSVFKPDDYTLPKMFSSKGYATACIGKWHLGWDWAPLQKEGVPVPSRYQDRRPEHFDWSKPIPEGPLDQGFDYYFGDGTINFPPYCWVENDRVLDPPTKMSMPEDFVSLGSSIKKRVGPMVDGWDFFAVLPTLTERAVEWVEEQTADKPFFLYFALPSPHTPIVPNEEFRGISGAGVYGDFMVETDAMAGKVLDALERKGFASNTIVVFTSDNGPEFYAYSREEDYGHWSSAPLRGLKRDLWEGGHRVPFIIKWPGKIKAGAVSDETISQVDLAATFAAIVGYDIDSSEAIDSYNLLPLLQGKPHAEPLRVATVQNTKAGAYALRQGDWIFIDAKTGKHEHNIMPEGFERDRGYKETTTPGLLFNLKKDLNQHHNLYEEYPEKVEEMKALLERYKGGEGCAPHSKK
jgi:arylsulfatase A-like enzyme